MKSSIASTTTTTTAHSNVPNRLKKRNRRPPACAACRTKKLRCDRILPSCTSCLTRPDVEHCDYSNPRFGRCGTRRTGLTAATPAPEPKPGPVVDQHQQPTPPELSLQPDDAADDSDAVVVDNDETIRASEEGGEERSEKPSERTMREKLERLERMIACLMESKACNRGASSCPSKKRPAGQPATDDEAKSFFSATAASSSRCMAPREGESMWTTLLNEKIQKWQQGLSRHQSTSPALGADDVQDKT